MQFEKYVPDYQAAYKKYYGEDISNKDALDGVIRLFNFAKATAEPISAKEEKKRLKHE